MKLRTILITLLMLLPVMLFAQGMVEGFESAEQNADTTYWGYEISDNASDTLSYVNVSYIDSPVSEGSKAMLLDYSVHNSEGWGGYAKIEHFNPDSGSTFNWSAYDSISFDYYVQSPCSEAGRVELRFEMYDVSNSEKGDSTYSGAESEFYYSFERILDDAPGWHRVTLALDRTDGWDDKGFTLTGWAGIPGNNQFDKDKIKGFAFEFSINGSGDGDWREGEVIIDNIALRGLQGIDFIVFNGKTEMSYLSKFEWGQSSLVVEEGAGATEGTNALKWTQGDEWGNGYTGAGWNIEPAANFLGSWDTDSLHFKMKAPAGTPACRFQFEDGANKVGQTFTPIDDGEWHDYAFRLNEMAFQDGSTSFDSTHVTVVQIMAEGNSQAGRVIYLDDIWTGNPIIDIQATGEVENFAVVPVTASMYNIVSWSDFADEVNEQYFVYASPNPIVDLNDPAVDHLGKFPKGEQTALHYLYYPLQDKETTMYYGIQCLDAFGNMGPLSTLGPVTNTAKGIATISMTPPADFAADGDVLEWENSGIKPFVLSKSTAFISRGEFTDDADMVGTVYMAMDNDNLYIAASNLEDNYTFDPAGNWWDQDAYEVFIGLYDQHGKKHSSFLRGDQPDFKIILKEDGLFREPTWTQMPDSLAGTPSYWFENWGGGEYVYEAKIPFDSLKLEEDGTFVPQNGMRIPLELTIHDNDNGTSEGNLVTSNTNKDNAYQTPEVWSYTWIGDTTATAIGNDRDIVAANFALEQNYPNPFNPLTTIQYTVAKNSLVELDIFNVLGQKIKTLVNGPQNAGVYRVKLDASEFASGVYFYQLKAGNFTQIRKMLLVK